MMFMIILYLANLTIDIYMTNIYYLVSNYNCKELSLFWFNLTLYFLLFYYISYYYYLLLDNYFIFSISPEQ